MFYLSNCLRYYNTGNIFVLECLIAYCYYAYTINIAWNFNIANCLITITGSGKVMQKLGMVYHYSYREQWQPKDISVVFRMYQLNLDGDNNRLYRAYWDKFPEHFVETEL